MSVFKDFQKAWSQRFPQCDIPKAWEDDVRGNLDKHRHKVALLKEELEKEQFYVDYLEKLLKGLNKSKANLSSGSKSEAINPASTKNSACDESDLDHYVTVITVPSYGADNKKSSHLHLSEKTGQKIGYQDEQKKVINDVIDSII
jgi:breakpoint cluster region protein